MATTTNFNLQKPDATKDVDEEFYQLQTTLDTLDGILKTLQDGISGKASTSHSHAISDVTGLETALSGKMAASQTFKLDSLTDVSGADEAANGYLLVKSALGWVPSSAVSALGTHGHAIGEITGLSTALNAKADADATASALSGKADASATTAALAGKASTSHSHSAATTGAAGFMSATDKAKLDNIASNANNTPNGSNALAIAGTDTTNRAWDATDLKAAAEAHSGNPSAFGRVRLRTSNGYGSTNTVIRRFSTVIENSGSDITYSDSAANGASFTINTDGVYAITYFEQFSGANWFGLSLNSTQLSTIIHAITAAHILTADHTFANGATASTSWVGFLSDGDVVRVHGSGQAAGGTVNACGFIIQRVA